METLRAPRSQHQFAGELQRLSRFQNVVDEENVASVNIAVDVTEQTNLAAFRSLAIARNGDELDIGFCSGITHGADEIRGENERTLEN